MDIVKRKLSELKLDSDNARLHNARNMSAIKESLLAFSQYAPIVVQESTGVIIAGNGTYQAAKDLGWDEIECVAVDVDDDTLKMMSIVDNRTGELSNWDNTSLLKVLTTLDELKLKKAGFKTDEVEKMMERTKNSNNLVIVSSDEVAKGQDSDKFFRKIGNRVIKAKE